MSARKIGFKVETEGYSMYKEDDSILFVWIPLDPEELKEPLSHIQPEDISDTKFDLFLSKFPEVYELSVGHLTRFRSGRLVILSLSPEIEAVEATLSTEEGYVTFERRSFRETKIPNLYVAHFSTSLWHDTPYLLEAVLRAKAN